MHSCASRPLVTKIFCPVRTHSPSRRSARVCSDMASLPAAGSGQEENPPPPPPLHQTVGQAVQPRTAVLLRNGQAEEAERGGAGDDLCGIPGIVIQFGRDGKDLLRRELAPRRLDEAMLLYEYGC